MRTLSTQRGFLAVLAVLLILVIGFIGLAITYLYVGSATATLNFQQADKALNIAEAGFESAARFLLTSSLSGGNIRIGCGSLSGNAGLTNTTFSNGTFTATAVSGNPVYVNTTLSSSINSSTTTIPLTSASGFASAGRIMIDSEIINYGAISGNNLIGVQRGVNANYNTPHASGAAVSQYQCMVDVLGGIPNLTSPIYKREIQQAMQLQEAWAVGVAAGGKFTITRWNRPTEVAWTDSSLTNAANGTLNGISMLSNANGWAVGNAVAPNFSLLHWTGSSWNLSTLAFSCSNQNLNAVSSVYSNEAWAVGVAYKSTGTCTGSGGKHTFTILKWNGSNWTELTPATSPSIPANAIGNANLNAVHVIDTTQSGAGTLGFAVGDTGTILKYNGTNWTVDTSPTSNNLLGVYVVSASEAWAVGAAGTIIEWNGSTWSPVTSPTATQMNAITMVDATLSSHATAGWAVGNSGNAIIYNGTSWSSQNTSTSQNLFGVTLFGTGNDAWAVGAAGAAVHWDGSAWVTLSSGISQQLNAISAIAPQQYPFAWQEIYP